MRTKNVKATHEHQDYICAIYKANGHRVADIWYTLPRCLHFHGSTTVCMTSVTITSVICG